MATFAWIVLGVVALVVILFGLGWLNAIRASAARNRRLDEMIRPALDAVRAGRPSAAETVAQVAAVAAPRNRLFASLTEMGKQDVFPVAYRSIEKVAESDLVCWLMHPNELGTPPSAVELVRTVPVRDAERAGSVLLFRFRTDPSHWASKRGWMAGVAGPYWDGDETPLAAADTFSEMRSFEGMTEEEHVNFLRDALKKRGLVVRS
jgi:hypothetical protein